MNKRVTIRRLRSGVEGLDEVLGGGVPEFSFNLIVGGPGCGKTTLAHQIMFANASPERPALYVTVLGEPPLKMLRYQQQNTFFDERKLGAGHVQFLHLGHELAESGIETVLERIIEEVRKIGPKLVFVDSFRAISDRPGATPSVLSDFIQRLSLQLTAWEVTSFLVGEYADQNSENQAVFTIADGVVWLRQSIERSSIVRRAQVLKIRGQAQIPGLHTYRISDDGLRVYPRMASRAPEGVAADREDRKSTGIEALDAMMGGGVPAGYTVMVVGPTGSGKSLLSTQFILEGIERGEPGVIAVFEKRPEEYLQTLPEGKKLGELLEEGGLRMMYLRPLDLSVEETMEHLRAQVIEIGAKRVTLDSISGFELALAPTYREDFRESLYRMISALTRLGVTVMMTAEVIESNSELRLSPHNISFLTDCLILQRYVDVGGRLTKAISVIKMRGCAHSDELRAYTIDADGIQLGDALTRFGAVFDVAPVPKAGPGGRSASKKKTSKKETSKKETSKKKGRPSAKKADPSRRVRA